MTRAGIILGTAAYMPPEQARGAAVDKRADVWAFGCLLYEMLTGRRAFPGDSTTDVLAAVVRAEPDWSALAESTPAPVRRLLQRCLVKDRKRRLPDIGVARLEIDDALSAATEPVNAPAAAPVQAKPRRPIPWIAGLAAALLIAAGAVWWAKRAPAPGVWTGTMLGGPIKTFGPRLSPDGQLLAFLAFVDQLPQLAVMKPNGGSWTVLTHDREHGYIATVAWSPDGSRIYFDRLWGIPLGVYSVPPLGGEPRLLLENAFGPEPLPDGSLVVLKLTDQGDEQLYHYWPDSGRLDPLPAFLPQTGTTPMLRAFPDGRELVYLGMTEAGRSQSPRLLVFDLSSRTAKELAHGLHVQHGTSWAPLDVGPDGQSVYMLSDQGDTRTLLQVPRKPGRTPSVLMSFPDTAAPVGMDAARDGSLYIDQLLYASSILRVAPTGGPPEEFGLPSAGTGIPVTGGEFLLPLASWGKQRLAAVRPGGEPRNLLETSEETSLPATIFGGNLAFEIGSGDQQRIALASLRDGRVVRRFSTRADNGISASPDGKTLYYAFSGAIWAQAVDGGEPKRVTEGIDAVLDPAGRFLYVKRSRKGTLALFRMPVAGGAEEELPVPPEFHVANPALSPAAVDARGRILVSVISNKFYYQAAILDPADKSFKLIPIAIDGDASSPAWTPDGRILARGLRYMLSMWRYQRAKSIP